jgi:aminoglycoside phosphotransferase (APT) family kinase protein
MSDARVTETPWRLAPEVLAERLGNWARHAIGPDAEVFDVSTPEGAGMSSETALFSVRTGGAAGEVQRLVARLQPANDPFPVFPVYDLALQQRCMQVVAEHTDVPVPATPWLEEDPQWLGSTFLVMSRVDGRVPADSPPYVFGGWLFDLPPEQRAEVQRNAVEVLAKLHRITPDTADLAFLDRPEHGDSPLRQHLAYQRYYYDWARGDMRSTLIERAFDWLEANVPPEGPTVLNWGDSRLGNMLFDGTAPVAVLDWEMAAVGPPEIDLAWMVFMHTFFQGMATQYGFPGLPDFMTRDEVTRQYEELTGHTVEHFDWYEMFEALRFAIVSLRTSKRGIAFGSMEAPDDPDDLIMFRPLMEAMLDAATPEVSA